MWRKGVRYEGERGMNVLGAGDISEKIMSLYTTSRWVCWRHDFAPGAILLTYYYVLAKTRRIVALKMRFANITFSRFPSRVRNI